MRQADDDLRNELRDTAQEFTTDRVGRMALAELFIELGTQLKTGSVDELLQGLDAPEGE
jgi:hypothetical protein